MLSEESYIEERPFDGGSHENAQRKLIISSLSISSVCSSGCERLHLPRHCVGSFVSRPFVALRMRDSTPPAGLPVFFRDLLAGDRDKYTITLHSLQGILAPISIIHPHSAASESKFVEVLRGRT